MALTPEDVVNKRFTITKFRDGYDLDQVDDFLDTIVEELRQSEAEKAVLQAEIDELKAKLEAAEAGTPAVVAQVVEEDVVEEATVVVAPVASAPAGSGHIQSFTDGDAMKSSAMLQLALELHDKHVLDGETRRDQLISDGETTAHRLVEEAQKTRADELALLGNERIDLQEKIKDLREFESEYRSTLRSYIQAQLRGLDGSPEPAGDPSALR
ncbi:MULTISPECIES: DivIVA domain-containing protein [unclassified Leucobacter]|uniref:DivIVA domain-containing protein n=1 Tax=unclassified Leucobacter TaxID=2621730 RepID=UPI00165E9257|nr:MULTISPECIES: DivIVA domain-containing protein [unclassified Leucobacter]MBC9926916.1 DivIVA domain-containing protein [Leucobacter sp. cx-169]